MHATMPSSELLEFAGAPCRRYQAIVAKASSDDENDLTTTMAALTGLLANPIVLWSEWTLKSTGSGLPPGPGGLLGAAEGVSYLVCLGIVGWSLNTKLRTGSGLKNGPYGLLGAAEGISYLSLLFGIIVFALNAFQH